MRFGPAGNAGRFYAEGHRSIWEAPLLAARGYCGAAICECGGAQADDAAAMRELWLREKGRPTGGQSFAG